MRLVLIASLALSLAACATPEPAPVVAAADPNAVASDVECHQETTMGSNMIHKVCHKKQTEAERNQLQEGLRGMPPNNGVAHQAAGHGT